MQNHLNQLQSKRRSFMSIKRKLEIIDEFHNSSDASKRKVARDNLITPKQLRTYLNLETQLRAQQFHRQARVVTNNRMCAYSAEEEETHAWYKSKRAAKLPISGKDLQDEMRGTVDREHPELSLSGKPFMASTGWLNNFCKRKRLTRRKITTSGRPFPVNSVEVLNEWINNINDVIEEFEFSKMEILGMDETFMYMDMPGSYTYEDAGARIVEVNTTGKEKVRLSCAYTANAAGNKLDMLGVIPRAHAINGMLTPDNFTPVYYSKGEIFN